MKKLIFLITVFLSLCLFIGGCGNSNSNNTGDDFKKLSYDELGKKAFSAMKAGKNKEAESLLNEMLKRQMENPEKSELGFIYFYLGQVTHNEKFFKKSEPLLYETLKRRESLTESKKNKVLNCYYILGRMALSQNKNDLAVKQLENAKKILAFQTKKKQEHINTYFYLAVGYYREKNWTKALENIKQSIDLCKKLNGINSPSTASCQGILAKILYDSGKMQEAISVIKKAHAVFLKSKGKNNETTVKLGVLLKKWEASS